MCFTKTWLRQHIPDDNIQGFQTFKANQGDHLSCFTLYCTAILPFTLTQIEHLYRFFIRPCLKKKIKKKSRIRLQAYCQFLSNSSEESNTGGSRQAELYVSQTIEWRTSASSTLSTISNSRARCSVKQLWPVQPRKKEDALLIANGPQPTLG